MEPMGTEHPTMWYAKLATALFDVYKVYLKIVLTNNKAVKISRTEFQ
jgi:hypothetical protein